MNTSCVPDNYEIPREDHEIGYNWHADICGRDIEEEKHREVAKEEERIQSYEAAVLHAQNQFKEWRKNLNRRSDYRIYNEMLGQQP